ncbi:MAG: dihydrolipoyl dehydrogenase [Prevotellaceae bacterium]|nr:dihydrolipoyl dehydrogenase [Prevotellaceae bacterium]
MKHYDVIVVGSGPGGFAAAARTAELGLQTALIESAELGGVCLNRGCIPTKTLLKSAKVIDSFRHAADYGVAAGNFAPDIEKIVAGARNVSDTLRKGLEFNLKKSGVDIIPGFAQLKPGKTVRLNDEYELKAENIVLAVGARPRELPALPIDELYVSSYKTALFPERIPESLLIVGSGAIGAELAWFYNALGAKVTIAEYLPAVLPAADDDVSAYLSRSLRKAGIAVTTGTNVECVTVENGQCAVRLASGKGVETRVFDRVLSAVGVTANIDRIGLEETGVQTVGGKIATDRFMQTSVAGIYAIGDVTQSPSLAHVASAEALVCAEKIAGRNPRPVDYNCIPACVYTVPEIASVGMTEREARAAGHALKIGKVPFTASGKAAAERNRDGFVKLIFDESSLVLLGAHLVGAGVTENIAALVASKQLELTAKQIAEFVCPHPSMSETVMEAAAMVIR